MDIRVLKYFLTVAREGNITRAAEVLHITQPTLSRQLKELEEEIGAKLLARGKRQVTLTQSGVLFQQRAGEIVALLEKTERDLAEQREGLGGVVSIGCVETTASMLLPDAVEAFSGRHPMVQYEIYSADGDDIREKLDQGSIDMGILVEPVEAAKYDFIRLPFKERWGILVRQEAPLARLESVRGEDILDIPLLIPRRTIVQNEIAGWLGVDSSRLHIIGSHNLLTNAALLAERGLCACICVQGACTIRETDQTKFIPFEPERVTGHVLAWKKNRVFNATTSAFIQYIRSTYGV